MSNKVLTQPFPACRISRKRPFPILLMRSILILEERGYSSLEEVKPTFSILINSCMDRRLWLALLLIGYGPRARFPKFFRSLGIFLDEEAVEQQQSSQSNSIVTYLLLYSGSPSAPLDAETQYLPDLNVSIIEVGQLNAGEAAISLCSDEGKDDSSSLEQYPLSLPLAQVNSDNFPPLSSGSPCMRYQYLFNATGARRTLFFVSALEVGDYQENYYLDGKPVNATRVFRRGGAFLLDISPGEHLFEVSLQPNEDQFVYPFQSFELYLFDLAS